MYNFCTVHTGLRAIPAVAAGLTDHTWSVEELLRLRLPRQAHSTPQYSATQDPSVTFLGRTLPFQELAYHPCWLLASYSRFFRFR